MNPRTLSIPRRWWWRIVQFRPIFIRKSRVTPSHMCMAKVIDITRTWLLRLNTISYRHSKKEKKMPVNFKMSSALFMDVWLHLQELAQLQKKEYIKTPNYWPFVRGIHWCFPSRRASSTELSFLSWRHHGISELSYHKCPFVGLAVWSIHRCGAFMMTSSNGNIFRVTGHLCG